MNAREKVLYFSQRLGPRPVGERVACFTHDHVGEGPAVTRFRDDNASGHPLAQDILEGSCHRNHPFTGPDDPEPDPWAEPIDPAVDPKRSTSKRYDLSNRAARIPGIEDRGDECGEELSIGHLFKPGQRKATAMGRPPAKKRPLQAAI